MSKISYEESIKLVTITLDDSTDFKITVNEREQVLNIMKVGKSLSDSICVLPIVSNVIRIK